MDAYTQLCGALDFIDLAAAPISMQHLRYTAQAQHIRRWLRTHPQRGELLSAILLAATALDQLAAARFDRAEQNMRLAAERIERYRAQLQLQTD